MSNALSSIVGASARRSAKVLSYNATLILSWTLLWSLVYGTSYG